MKMQTAFFDVPPPALEFLDRIGSRAEFEELLSAAAEYYAPIHEMSVVFDPRDPTFGDEQMQLNITVSPNGLSGTAADLSFMSLLHEKFSPELCSRITPNSFSLHPTTGSLNGRA